MKFSFSKIGAYVSIIKRLPAIVQALQELIKELRDGVDAEDYAIIAKVTPELEGLVADIAAALR
jgi:hypothetical protein